MDDSERSHLLTELRELQFPYRQGLLTSGDASQFLTLVSDIVSHLQNRRESAKKSRLRTDWLPTIISAELIAETREKTYDAKKPPYKSEDYRGPYTGIIYRPEQGFKIYREEQALPAYEDVDCGYTTIKVKDADGKRIATILNLLVSVMPLSTLHVSHTEGEFFFYDIEFSNGQLKNYTPRRA